MKYNASLIVQLVIYVRSVIGCFVVVAHFSIGFCTTTSIPSMQIVVVEIAIRRFMESPLESWKFSLEGTSL